MSSQVGINIFRLDPELLTASRRGILGAFTHLLSADGLTYLELRVLTSLTEVNLSTHARRLEDAGYLWCEKSFVDLSPRTTYQATGDGLLAFEKHWGKFMRLRTRLELRLRDLKSPERPGRRKRRDRGEPFGEALP